MNRLLYSLLLYLLSPIIWCYLLLRAIKAPEYREGALQRLGFGNYSSIKNGILLHCASVGEVRAAAPLIHQLIQHYPQCQIVVTTTTPTGKNTLIELFGDTVHHRYLPVDWPGSSARLINNLVPRIVILMETELWLNLLTCCTQKNIPVLLANARLSAKSLVRYQKYSQLTQQLLQNITKIAAQYVADKKHFVQLGCASDKIELVGSIKFDMQLSASVQQAQAELKKQWSIERPVWIAVSIHPAEFDWVIQTHQALLKSLPDLLLIAVPRHPEKFAELKEKCLAYQMNFIARSEMTQPNVNTQIIVGDTLGEMLSFCDIADIAYVGGSLIERGGHNPLEPLVCGLPVIMGAHYYNFTDIVQLLIEKNLLDVVQNQTQLVDTLKARLSNRDDLQQKSIQAHALMNNHRGCVDKLLQLIDELI